MRLLVVLLFLPSSLRAEPCTATQLAAELEKAPPASLKAMTLRTKVLLTAQTDDACRAEIFRTFYEYAASTSQLDLPSLTRTLGPVLPTVWREFLALHQEADTATLLQDGAITVPAAELRKRGRRWESFAARYPTFVQTRLAKDLGELCFRLLITGSPQTSTFDSDGKLRADVRTELEAYAADRAAPRRQAARTYLTILRRQSFHRSPLSAAYLQKLFP